MGRKRTCLELSATQRAELQQLARTTAGARARERAQLALWAASGEHTLEDLAQLAGRARATIQLWLDKFRADGVRGLLARDTPPGLNSPLATAAVQAELRAGLATGRWRSASAVAVWLEETHGIKRSRKSIYYWFTKMGRRGHAVADDLHSKRDGGCAKELTVIKTRRNQRRRNENKLPRKRERRRR